MTKIDNPRFPHRVKIYRPVKGEDGNVSDKDGIPYPPELVFESECGYREKHKSRTTGQVIVADILLGLPIHKVLLLPGDIVEMTDYQRTYRGTLVDSKVYNMGANIWFNETKN